jgi:hypothetical protein
MLQGVGQMGSGDKRHHLSGPGFTIPAFAKRFGLPVQSVRRAVTRGEIKSVPFNGVLRIPFAEAERFSGLFGLKPRDGAED